MDMCVGESFGHVSGRLYCSWSTRTTRSWTRFWLCWQHCAARWSFCGTKPKRDFILHFCTTMKEVWDIFSV